MPERAAVAAPRWALVWAAVLLVMQGWHAAAALLAPESLPGGRFFWVGFPFQGYATRFAPYDEPGNGFLLATTVLDLAEMLVVGAGLLLLVRGCGRGVLLVAGGLLLYAYKTIVVVAIEVASGFPSLTGVSQAAIIGWYLAPQVAMAGASLAACLALLRPWWRQP